MTSLIVVFTSLLNSYLIKNIDFGDKMLDTSIITACGIIFTSFIAWSMDKTSDIYNWLVYHLWYKRRSTMFVFNTSWYYHDKKATVINYHRLSIHNNVMTHNSLWYYITVSLKFNNQEIFTEGDPTMNLSYSKTFANSLTDQSYNMIRSPQQSIRPYFYKGKAIVYTNATTSEFYCKRQDVLYEMIGHLEMMMEEDNKNQEKMKVQNRENIIYHCIPSSNVNTNTNASLIQYGVISKNKSIHKMHYEQKDILIHMIDKFSKGMLYPPSVGMDNKLGILLYGPPGTGKTGTILSIANYLGRSVITINFSKITKKKDLDFILNHKNYKSSIFVFDEFDCILDVLVKREKKEEDEKNEKKNERKENYGKEKSEKIDWAHMLLTVNTDEERKQILNTMRDVATGKKEDDNIDLGYLLSKLDGLEDCTGRFIIATTNHPENINPALLRPGRFDLKLCLGNCTRDMYAGLLKSYFNEVDMDVIQKEVEKIKEKKWSPLEVVNISLISGNFQDAIKKLSEE